MGIKKDRNLIIGVIFILYLACQNIFFFHFHRPDVVIVKCRAKIKSRNKQYARWCQFRDFEFFFPPKKKLLATHLLSFLGVNEKNIFWESGMKARIVLPLLNREPTHRPKAPIDGPVREEPDCYYREQTDPWPDHTERTLHIQIVTWVQSLFGVRKLQQIVFSQLNTSEEFFGNQAVEKPLIAGKLSELMGEKRNKLRWQEHTHICMHTHTYKDITTLDSWLLNKQIEKCSSVH